MRLIPPPAALPVKPPYIDATPERPTSAAEDRPMKHPVRSDFDVAVLEAGVTVTFKPTRSIYSFYRLANTEDIARLGPVTLGRVRHAGASGDTEDYPPDEVQEMAQRIASESAASVWAVQDEEKADKLTTVRPVPTVGDEGD